mmetsp:Transcript_56449/g.136998  ORF Transcript_56449/g.136998 Transcript_56449/m.136998 type:complete len:435 (-) Transcript_56449:166-1470(-)
MLKMNSVVVVVIVVLFVLVTLSNDGCCHWSLPILMLLPPTDAFTASSSSHHRHQQHQHQYHRYPSQGDSRISLLSTSGDKEHSKHFNDDNSDDGATTETSASTENLNRRDFGSTFLKASASALATTSFLPSDNSRLFQTASSWAIDDDKRKPVAIIGGNGRSGALCVMACLNRGIPVRALTRSGTWSSPSSGDENDGPLSSSQSSLLSIQQCDVRDADALRSGILGCQAVIYAASASKKGGKAKEVDNEAVIATANSCIDCNVQRYVVISSTASSRPKSLGYKFTNVYQNIMAEKRIGELGVVESYQSVGGTPSSSPSYTIIRPGGLEEPKLNAVLGPSKIELSQGDVLAGILSRADLAEVAVETAISQSSHVKNTSFEVYYTESTQPCEGRFKTYLKDNDSSDAAETISRIHGETYSQLLDQLKKDGTYFVPS